MTKRSFRKINKLLALLLAFAILPACVNLNLDSARELGSSGTAMAGSAKSNLFATRIDFQNALDGEAILHGATNTVSSPSYKDNLKQYDILYAEITSRSVVFDKLAEVYHNFGALAAADSPAAIEASLGEFAGAIRNYQGTVGSRFSLSDESISVITKVGGLLAKERKKRMVRKASVRISAHLQNLIGVMQTSGVRTQLTTFRKVLISSEKAAVDLLLTKNIFDQTAVYQRVGQGVGLTPISKPTLPAYGQPEMIGATREVINQRFRYRYRGIEESYSAVLNGLTWLVLEHKKLEEGDAMDLKRITSIVAELQYFTDLVNNQGE